MSAHTKSGWQWIEVDPLAAAAIVDPAQVDLCKLLCSQRASRTEVETRHRQPRIHAALLIGCESGLTRLLDSDGATLLSQASKSAWSLSAVATCHAHVLTYSPSRAFSDSTLPQCAALNYGEDGGDLVVPSMIPCSN